MSGVEEKSLSYAVESATHKYDEKFLGDLISLEYGSTLLEQNRAGHGFPVYGSNGVVGYHSQYLVEGPGIIIGRKGSMGEVSWSKDNFWPIDTSYYVQPKNQVNLRWLFWALRNADLTKLDAATGVPGLNRHDAYAVRVPAPEFQEQSRIAAILDTLDAAIEKSEALIAKLKQVRAGMLHDLLMYGVDESSGADSDKSIPRYWPSVVLGKLAEITGGVTLGRSVDGQDAIELPYLRVANVQDGFIDTNDVKTVRIFRSELQRYALSSGDVLMNEGGDFDKLGRGAVWDGRISPCLHQNHVFRVRCGDRLLPVFLALYSASPAGKRYFVQASKQTTNLASINLTQLKAFPIKLPDIAEQSKIVKLIRTYAKHI